MRGWVRAAARAFEMSMKMRVINPFSYLNWLVFPLILVLLGLVLLTPGGTGRSAYAILGGGLIGFWTMTYLEGGNEIGNERWQGTLEQVMGCPTPLAVIVVGKVVSSILVGAFSFLPAIAFGFVVFHRTIEHVDVVPFVLSFLALSFAFFSTALLLAPLYAMWRWAFSLTNGLEIGVYVVCGFMFPVTQLPSWLQAISSVLAPTWATRSLYAATGQPGGHDYVLWCGVSLALSFGYLVLSWLGFRLVDSRARVTGQLALA